MIPGNAVKNGDDRLVVLNDILAAMARFTVYRFIRIAHIGTGFASGF